MNVFDRPYETMPRADREQLQLERLQALLARLRRNVRRYRELLGETRLASLKDITQLPMTTPEELADAFPYGMFALPLREVIRLHSTLGPAGRPLVIGHSANDLAHWSRLAARQLIAAGVTAHDVIQISVGLGTLGSAAGFTLGAERIEASVIPEDPVHIDYQLAMLRNYRATVLVTTPTNAHAIARRLEQRRIDPQSLHLRVVLLTRPIPPAERETLSAGLFASIRCHFGIPEILDPGFSVECSAGHFHVNEDEFLPEIVDGELVVTTLAREALPLLRFRARQAAELSEESCSCGRTGRIIRPGRRLDDRLLINDIPLYAAQFAEALAETHAAGRSFRVECDERGVVVSVEVTDGLFHDTMRDLAELKSRIQSELHIRLGIDAAVRFVAPPSTPPS